MTSRNYEPLLSAVRVLPDDASRNVCMQAFVEHLWRCIGGGTAGEGRGCSWAGFYVGPGQRTPEGQLASDGEMLLAVREPKPACSPIGMHGACGRGWREGVTLVVTDVAHLAEGYVACDPKDLSELVVPCFDEDGLCWGVLDLDSFERGAFTQVDAAALDDALRLGRLTAGDTPAIVTI